MADFEDNKTESGSPFSEKRFQDGEKRFDDKIDFSGSSSRASFERKEPDDIQDAEAVDESEIPTAEIQISEQPIVDIKEPEKDWQPEKQVQNQQAQYSAYTEADKVKGKGKAITSMILGIAAMVTYCLPFISIPCLITGLIFGIISLAKKMPGKGMAIAGVIICCLAIPLSIAGIEAMISVLSGMGAY